jgi:hypothetical protein
MTISTPVEVAALLKNPSVAALPQGLAAQFQASAARPAEPAPTSPKPPSAT